MSETRKNHLTIDGGQVKEDENVATYKPIPDADSGFKSKPTLSKSKEKVSDEAEEKLLDKEAEAKIVTRVDMADAKYVVGDHRNGDAKIELDANKRQFSGLTKEELLKYADDPFWVRLRWLMFVLFWALWLCMLAGAVAIIVRAPKCAPPPPKTWYELGPLVDASAEPLAAVEEDLPAMQSTRVQGVFADFGPAYDPSWIPTLKDFAAKAKQYGVKVIVDLTPNFVPSSHAWFRASVNRTEPYAAYFTWAAAKDYVDGTTPSPPNNWVSTLNTSAWTWNEDRKQFYLHQYGEDQPDLDFHNPAVVKEFDAVLKAVMAAGASGVRLHKVRQILVNQSLPDEVPVGGQGGAAGADHGSHAYYAHRHTRDQPPLPALLKAWAKLVDDGAAEPGTGETVFTLAEDGGRAGAGVPAGLASGLRPQLSASLQLRAAAPAAAALNKLLEPWPVLQLTAEGAGEEGEELAALGALLPAAPVLALAQIAAGNDTAARERLSRLMSLRDDASIKHGLADVRAVPAVSSDLQLLACARWKKGHTGYLGVYNPGAELVRANLTLRSVPAALTLHHVSPAVAALTNYTINMQVERDNVLVPAKSTVVLSYVPLDTEEQ